MGDKMSDETKLGAEQRRRHVSAPGALDRRQVLKGLGLTGAALSVPGLLRSGNALAASGGTMTWAKPLETTMLDPQTSILGSSWQTLHLVYDSLVDMDDRMNLIPALAESWEQTSPTTYGHLEQWQFSADIVF